MWWEFENHVFNKYSSLVMSLKRKKSLANSHSLALGPRILEVRNCGWGYLQLQEREKWLLFLIHTCSLHHCLPIMPPNLNRVRVAPLLSDKLQHPRRRRRETCQTGAVPRGCSVGGHWVQLPRSAPRAPCLVFSEACSRWNKEPSDSKGFQGRDALLFSFPFLLSSLSPWALNLLCESASN